jgi:hypothetical protein
VRGHQGNDNPFVVDPSLADRTCGSGALPVELVAFTATLDGGHARLDWTTASETANAGFHVEHQAPGAFGVGSFVPTAFVAGQNTTLEAQAYAYRTAPLSPGVHRFRLRQVDLDGAFAHSPVVELSVAARALSVYPSPATSRVRIARPAGAAAAVYDLLGRRVAALDPDADTLDVSALSPGLYVVRSQGQSGTFVRR